MNPPNRDMAERTPTYILERKLRGPVRFFGALVLLGATAAAQVNSTAPFTGQYQEGFETSVTLATGHAPNQVLQGQADYCAGYPIRSTSWSFDCSIYAHDGTWFVGDASGGQVWFDFYAAPTRFGGYFGSNQPDGTSGGTVTVTVRFYDSALTLLHTETDAFQNDCTWNWMGWEILMPNVARIEFEASPSPGFMMMDDLELDTQPGQGCGVGAPFCLGDDPIICPCGNASTNGGGCANGTGSGVVLCGSGSDSVGSHDLVLHVNNIPSGQPGVFFQGNNAVNSGTGVPFMDGLRCAGGAVVRLQVVFPDANGEAATTVNIIDKGGVNIADVRRYQFWYRDANTSVCGSSANLSNGVEITFGV